MLSKLSADNMHIFMNLVQAYEAEFSSLTKKIPDSNGLYNLDFKFEGGIIGYLFYESNFPVGFVIIDLEMEPFNISEFYVVPSYRNKNVGYKIFLQTLKNHPGRWQVKQIEGAHLSTKFWRKIIKNYTNNNFFEDTLDDPYWGKVKRQLFKTI